MNYPSWAGAAAVMPAHLSAPGYYQLTAFTQSSLRLIAGNRGFGSQGLARLFASGAPSMPPPSGSSSMPPPGGTGNGGSSNGNGRPKKGESALARAISRLEIGNITERSLALHYIEDAAFKGPEHLLPIIRITISRAVERTDELSSIRLQALSVLENIGVGAPASYDLEAIRKAARGPDFLVRTEARRLLRQIREKLKK
ncbi:MAG: hypothetical protein JXA24_07100 [Proteobacteria bacterium]|nr:hypothetical protein [Pseudomonadota bacterium]